MYNIAFTESYDKKVVILIKNLPELKKQYEKCLILLELNPYNPSLRLHRLKGRLVNVHSVSINLAYRITIEFLIKENFIIPVEIGRHEGVYG